MIGDEYSMAQELHDSGMEAHERKQFDEAERSYLNSLEIRERIGDEYGRAQTLHQLGKMAWELPSSC